MAVYNRIRLIWAKFLLGWSGTGPIGRMAARMAAWTEPPYYGQVSLAMRSPRGFVASSARIYHEGLQRGRHVYLGDHTLIYCDDGGGPVNLGDFTKIFEGTRIQTGGGGSLVCGEKVHVQPQCQISAYCKSIHIGSRTDIAPHCALYSYDHQIDGATSVRSHGFSSRGDILIGEDVWLGYGVIVLSGVTIGRGAVIGAGSVVTRNIPAMAIAVGNPARVVRHRDQS